MTEYVCEKDEFDETNQTFYKGEEIVRCRDCKYIEEINKETYFGTQVTWYECTELWNKSEEHKVVEPDYYCAWGDHK